MLHIRPSRLALVAVALSACLVGCAIAPPANNAPLTTTASAPASTTTPTPTPTPVPTPATRTATLVMNGDLLWHNTVYWSAQSEARRTGKGADGFDFDPMFAALKPIIAGADVAICQEEVPFAAPGAPYLSYPVFAAPPQIAAWLGTMGYDACTTDSNHAIDQGFAGLVRTDTLLESAGIRFVGTFRTAEERAKPVIVQTAAGVKVGIVGGTYSLNGMALPTDKQWAVSLWDAPNLLAQAHAARLAGADIVVVQLHGGNEYQVRPTAEQAALAATLTASDDVDLVFGEHVHVVQPVTKVNGKWVVYGMGNLVAQQVTTQPRTYEGLTMRFTFTGTVGGRYSVTKAEYIGTLITSGDPVRVYPVVSSLAAGTGPTARLQTARAAIAASVNLLGAQSELVES
jgi:poly-gamma-glutamate synthesis protein (capsule biosynthesis protein)